MPAATRLREWPYHGNRDGVEAFGQIGLRCRRPGRFAPTRRHRLPRIDGVPA